MQAVEAALAHNAEVLSRYRKVQSLPAGGRGQVRKYEQTINLAKLHYLGIGLDLKKGRSMQALEKWQEHQGHQGRMVQSGGNWMYFIVNLVGESLSHSSLEFLMNVHPQVVKENAQSVLAALGTGDLSRYRLGSVIRDEYQMFERYVVKEAGVENSIKLNRFRNRYDRHAREFLTVADRRAANMHEALVDLKDKSSQARFGEMFDAKALRVWQVLMESEVKRSEVIKSTWRREAHRRHLVLRVKILAQNLAAESIPGFLANQGPELRSPVDGRPFTFNVEERKLIEDLPSHSIRVETRI
jgi:hypothetical protein